MRNNQSSLNWWLAIWGIVFALISITHGQGFYLEPFSCSSAQNWQELGCYDTTAQPFTFAVQNGWNGDDPSRSYANFNPGGNVINSTVTPKFCVQACRAHGFRYASLYDRTCRCGTVLGSLQSKRSSDQTLCYATPDANPCGGDKSENCGQTSSNNHARIFVDPSFETEANLMAAGSTIVANSYLLLGCFNRPNLPSDDSNRESRQMTPLACLVNLAAILRQQGAAVTLAPKFTRFMPILGLWGVISASFVATVTSVGSSGATNYVNFGCYDGGVSSALLYGGAIATVEPTGTPSSIDVDRCVSYCAAAGKSWAAVGGPRTATRCVCGDRIGVALSGPIAMDYCNEPCQGTGSQQNCGDTSRVIVYAASPSATTGSWYSNWQSKIISRTHIYVSELIYFIDINIEFSVHNQVFYTRDTKWSQHQLYQSY
ncbi:hypothetical protein SCUP234_01916 [Seiridium cupressi]